MHFSPLVLETRYLSDKVDPKLSFILRPQTIIYSKGPYRIHKSPFYVKLFQTETLGQVLVLLMGLFHGKGGTG